MKRAFLVFFFVLLSSIALGETSYTSGLAPMPGDQKVPQEYLPAGADAPDRGPSAVIYPAQTMAIRFNHAYHVDKQHRTCKACHAGSVTSTSVADRLVPPGTVCDACHMTDHTNLAKVEAGDDDMGKCGFCHVGWKDGDGNKVAALVIPRANMVFNHKAHADRNIGCGQCHGSIDKLELATRDQLPRMKGCFGCHQMPDPLARGDAKGACDTCHIRGVGRDNGKIQTMFASGTLVPPKWMHNAFHDPSFLERHKWVAGNDSAFCANCHSEDFCVACHDGRVRPRNVHPADYLNMHAVEARFNMEKCTSCHREQSFCLACHQRAGVSMSGPTAAREAGRFHPPKEVWSDPPRKPGHHAFEAQRNLGACVSCHIERDCAICHGARGVGAGFNPHRGSFVGGCGVQFRRNPRPCFVCHDPTDTNLAMCR